MVSAHFWLMSYSVKTEAQTPAQQVHYLQREGTYTKDYHDYVTGDVQHLPAWAQNDPSLFFTMARAHEFPDRYYAFQMEFSLPNELTHPQQMAIREDLMDALMPDLPALWAKHEKRLESSEMHPHIHVLFSARKQDGIPRDERQTFKRWNAASPAKGGCEKDLFWSQWHAPEQLRHAFADITNYHLEMGQAHQRVDPRSLKRREIHRKAIGRGGEQPIPEQLAREQAQAAGAWEQRKASKGLGDVTQIPREEFVLLVRQWTREHVRGTAVAPSPPDVVRAWERNEATRLAHERRTIAAEVRILDRSIQRPTPTRSRTPEEPSRTGLRAHIFEKEPSHERGVTGRGY